MVDDEPETRDLLRAALTDEGYEVREASNGVEALAVAQQWRPDAILLDLMMPVMNGWQFADAYEAQAGRTAPVVALTAAGPAALRSAVTVKTIAAVLAKPFDVEELLGIVGWYIGRAPTGE